MAARRNREKRVLLTRDEEREVHRVLRAVSDQFQCKVSFSDVARAALRLVRTHGGNLTTEAKKRGPLDRPANRDPGGFSDFEEEIAETLQQALRHKRRRALPSRRRR